MSRRVTTRVDSKPKSSRLEFFGQPPLLHGEDSVSYDQILGRLREEIRPDGIIQEMLIRDIADHDWELSRIRRFKATYINSITADEIWETLHNGIKDEYFGGGEKDLVAENDGHDHPDQNADGEDRSAFGSLNELMTSWRNSEKKAVEEVADLLDVCGQTVEKERTVSIARNIEMLERIDQILHLSESNRNRLLNQFERTLLMSSHLHSIVTGNAKLVESTAVVEEISHDQRPKGRVQSAKRKGKHRAKNG